MTGSTAAGIGAGGGGGRRVAAQRVTRTLNAKSTASQGYAVRSPAKEGGAPVTLAPQRGQFEWPAGTVVQHWEQVMLIE